MNTYFFRFLCISIFLPVFVVAQSPVEMQNKFQQFFTVEEQEIMVPTVVEVSLPEDKGKRTQFLVIDDTTGLPVGSLYTKTFEVQPVPYTVSVNGTVRPTLVDLEQETSETFPLPVSDNGLVELTVVGDDVFSASSFALDLAQNVSLPTSIQVTAEVDGTTQTILARSELTSTLVLFPETTASNWNIALEYAQPLRVNEVRFIQIDAEAEVENTLRFLAQPMRTYTVYVDPETYVSIPAVESGNLSSDIDVLVVSDTASYLPNPEFQFTDSDEDGIADRLDNCVSVPNPDQTDVNNNNRGDACDDFDKDGIINAIDNCQNEPNRNQLDDDGDGIGDMCDEEESRVTEKYGWIPWAAMAGAISIFILLFWIMMRRMHGEVGQREERESMQSPKSDRKK